MYYNTQIKKLSQSNENDFPVITTHRFDK